VLGKGVMGIGDREGEMGGRARRARREKDEAEKKVSGVRKKKNRSCNLNTET
jgi:hypothetical protein